MKQLPSGMQEHLDSGATTLCWCWRLARRDGSVLGFTDHDRDLEFGGVRYEAASGFTAGEMEAGLGLAADNLEAGGALRSEHINEDDLARGLFDDARVEIFRVNWRDVSQRVLMSVGSLGEVKRGPHAFAAEIRGLAHYLQQPGGRLIQYGCDAALGDERCGVNVGPGSSWRVAASVASVETRHGFVASGLASYEAGWFSRGIVNWKSGANAGAGMEIKQHVRREGGEVFIELWRDMAFDIAPGDSFEIVAGCDKQFATCRDKFANHLNFRGFPHVPGNDFLVSYPNRGDASNDGENLVK